MKTAKKLSLALLVFLLCLLSVTGCSPEPAASSDIPLEQALSSGKPTLAEFGRGTCIPCKAMKPILEELSIEYRGRLNVVIVDVDNYQNLTSASRIMAIPTQIFYDSSGKEITRHIGFFAREDIIAQLDNMGME